MSGHFPMVGSAVGPASADCPVAVIPFRSASKLFGRPRFLFPPRHRRPARRASRILGDETEPFGVGQRSVQDGVDVANALRREPSLEKLAVQVLDHEWCELLDADCAERRGQGLDGVSIAGGGRRLQVDSRPSQPVSEVVGRHDPRARHAHAVVDGNQNTVAGSPRLALGVKAPFGCVAMTAGCRIAGELDAIPPAAPVALDRASDPHLPPGVQWPRPYATISRRTPLLNEVDDPGDRT